VSKLYPMALSFFVVVALSTGVVLAADEALPPSDSEPPAWEPDDASLSLAEPAAPIWTLDYRVRSYVGSHTSFQFGAGNVPKSYAPLSKLDWSLDSVWSGLEVGVEKPDWRISCEWLMPMTRDISGRMEDFDWSGADRAPGSIQQSSERWREGQVLDLKGAFKLTDHISRLPIEVWPTTGFRFQRFSMMAFDTLQVVNDSTIAVTPPLPPAGTLMKGDSITFNQQYYMAYIGGQLRAPLELFERHPLQLIFQGDWAATWGYNVDHHLGYEPSIHSFCMDTTQGGAMHLALAAETPLSKRFSLGFQVDHTAIRTSGSHHDLETGARTNDVRNTDGVYVRSDQTSLTAYLRGSF
jgi:hypothetical protein